MERRRWPAWITIFCEVLSSRPILMELSYFHGPDSDGLSVNGTKFQSGNPEMMWRGLGWLACPHTNHCYCTHIKFRLFNTSLWLLHWMRSSYCYGKFEIDTKNWHIYKLKTGTRALFLCACTNVDVWCIPSHFVSCVIDIFARYTSFLAHTSSPLSKAELSWDRILCLPKLLGLTFAVSLHITLMMSMWGRMTTLSISLVSVFILLSQEPTFTQLLHFQYIAHCQYCLLSTYLHYTHTLDIYSRYDIVRESWIV